MNPPPLRRTGRPRRRPSSPTPPQRSPSGCVPPYPPSPTTPRRTALHRRNPCARTGPPWGVRTVPRRAVPRRRPRTSRNPRTRRTSPNSPRAAATPPLRTPFRKASAAPTPSTRPPTARPTPAPPRHRTRGPVPHHACSNGRRRPSTGRSNLTTPRPASTRRGSLAVTSPLTKTVSRRPPRCPRNRPPRATSPAVNWNYCVPRGPRSYPRSRRSAAWPGPSPCGAHPSRSRTVRCGSRSRTTATS